MEAAEFIDFFDHVDVETIAWSNMVLLAIAILVGSGVIRYFSPCPVTEIFIFTCLSFASTLMLMFTIDPTAEVSQNTNVQFSHHANNIHSYRICDPAG